MLFRQRHTHDSVLPQSIQYHLNVLGNEAVITSLALATLTPIQRRAAASYCYVEHRRRARSKAFVDWLEYDIEPTGSGRSKARGNVPFGVAWGGLDDRRGCAYACDTLLEP